MAEQPAIKTGQIWVEMDPREERYVEIMSVWPGGEYVDVRRVAADGVVWPKGRRLPASVQRFNGKRGGYAIHKDI